MKRVKRFFSIKKKEVKEIKEVKPFHLIAIKVEDIGKKRLTI